MRAGWASSAGGKGPVGPHPGGSTGPGSVSVAPAKTRLGLVILFAAMRAATVVW